jgi:hypothetical protein
MYAKHRITFIALNPDDLPDILNRFGAKLQVAIKTRR